VQSIEGVARRACETRVGGSGGDDEGFGDVDLGDLLTE